MSNNDENIPVTVLAWNEAAIVVSYALGEGDAQTRLAKLQKELHHQSDDPRWQILHGWAAVQVQP